MAATRHQPHEVKGFGDQESSPTASEGIARVENVNISNTFNHLNTHAGTDVKVNFDRSTPIGRLP